MSKINTPPLIEAIFELRWGETSPNNYFYDDDDKTTFLMKFGAAAAMKEYGEIEAVNSSAPDKLPMFIKHRFWKTKDVWPCMQIGMGIMTVNHTDKDYKWDDFLNTISECVEIFNSSDNQKLSKIMDTGRLRLIYQDLFSIEDLSDLPKTLKEKLNIEFTIPTELLIHENLKGINSLGLSFGLETIEPVGSMSIKISQVITVKSDKPAFLVETTIDSKMKDVNAKSVEDIKSWAIQAHDLQKHSYSKLMKG
jgi:uncharacterized protein (TIGR04255 family)